MRHGEFGYPLICRSHLVSRGDDCIERFKNGIPMLGCGAEEITTQRQLLWKTIPCENALLER